MVTRLKLILFLILVVIFSVCVIAALLCHAIIGSPEKGLMIAKGFDRMCNVLIGGVETEFISSHVGRMQRDGDWWGITLAPVIDFFFGKDHCKNAIGK